MEWNDLVVGQVLHLAHFPERKSTKGVPNRWKINLHQICFSKPRMIWYNKGSPPVWFWEEKRSCLECGSLLCGNSVPKFWLNLYHSNMIWIKSHISGHLLRWPPLIFYHHLTSNLSPPPKKTILGAVISVVLIRRISIFRTYIRYGYGTVRSKTV